MRAALVAVLLVGSLCACTREARFVGPSTPQTPPHGDSDPRVAAYQDNVAQIGQGGRYFAWYGCSGCHADGARGGLNLADAAWHRGGGFAQVYRSVAEAHGALAFGARIPPEQLWQLTAYVRDLSAHAPEKRRRQAVDQQGEPVGPGWSGPL